jgi:hypothetical protein
LDEKLEFIDVPIVWVGVEDIPIQYVNQAIGQVGRGGEFFLSLGQLTPPPLVGTPEQQAEQAQQISYVPIKPVARLGLTRLGVEELIGVLQQTLQNYDRVQKEQGGWGP